MDRPKLLEVTSTTDDEMGRVVGLMQELCPSAFGCGATRTAASAAPGSGRKRAVEEAHENENEAGSEKERGGGRVPPSGAGPRERGNRGGEEGEGEEGESRGGSSFEEWKERMRAQETAQGKKRGSTAPGHGTCI